MSGFPGQLEKLFKGGSLTGVEAREAMDHIVSGDADASQVAGFLGVVQGRGVTAEELAGFAESMRAKSVRVVIDRVPIVDTCGTGGDGLNTFNFSTAAALVVAGAGVAVAKHGNRAASSKSGSADVLEALGVAVDSPPDSVRRSIEETGFGFLFAPRYHPAMRHVAPLRRALGVPTVFNLLGPLVNPAMVTRQVIGIYDGDLLEKYSRVLELLGAERAIIAHGADGMDELTLTGSTILWHIERGKAIRTESIEPEEVGLCRTQIAALRGSGPAENARSIEGMLRGETGPLLDGTLLNAAAALVVAGVVSDLKEGIAMSRESVASGRAFAVLSRLRRLNGGARDA